MGNDDLDVATTSKKVTICLMLVCNFGCQCYRKCDSNAALSKLYKVPKENMLRRNLILNLL